MAQLIPHNIQYFKSQLQFREWLENNSNSHKELWVGFYKKHTGKPNLTWSESVDQALCFGWIDGIRKSIDELSYAIRFTPRNPKSIWSNINIKKVEELTKLGLMKPKGIKLFETRTDKNSGIYSFEQKEVTFEDPYLAIFKENTKAWDSFCKMPPSYQKACAKWVLSAKLKETLLKRLNTLINNSEAGEKIALVKKPNSTI